MGGSAQTLPSFFGSSGRPDFLQKSLRILDPYFLALPCGCWPPSPSSKRSQRPPSNHTRPRPLPGAQGLPEDREALAEVKCRGKVRYLPPFASTEGGGGGCSGSFGKTRYRKNNSFETKKMFQNKKIKTRAPRLGGILCLFLPIQQSPYFT